MSRWPGGLPGVSDGESHNSGESDGESDEENKDDSKEVIKVMDLEPSFKKVEESKNANGLNMHKKSKHTTDKSN